MSVMSCKRFLQLRRYFHLTDNNLEVPAGQPGHDRLFKVCPVLTLLNRVNPALYKTGVDLSIDEAMVKYKGRSFLKQYLPKKTTKWGFKVRGFTIRDDNVWGS